MQTQTILKRAGNYSRVSRKRVHEPELVDLLLEICNIFDQDIYKVQGDCRDKWLVSCRRLYSYVAQMVTRRSLKEIGELIGRDHTTVIHHRETVKGWLKNKDSIFMNEWERYTELSIVWNQFGTKP